MAIIVEDGTGLSDAESYISVADATSYLALYAANSAGVAPSAWTGAASDAVRENALRQATQWIDRKFSGQWKGRRYLAAQRLMHPRISLEIDGFAWSSLIDGLPRALTEACAEVALLFIGGEVLFENQDTSGRVLEEKLKLGPIETFTKYSGGRSEDDVYSKVEASLSQLIESSDSVIRG